jgi:hypothetical protein
VIREFTVIVRGKSVTFKSPYSDDEAIEIVRKRATQVDSAFGLGLVTQYDVKQSLSEKQWRWVHKLAVDATAPQAATGVQTLELNLIKVVAMLHFAKRYGEIKYPAIRVELEGLPGVKLTLAGGEARFPGSVNILCNGRWMGRIHKRGNVEPRDLDPQVLEVLKRLEADPAGVATLHGRRTGNCCFCGRHLEQKDSVACGYGPICAAKFGLPHAGMAEDDETRALMQGFMSALRGGEPAPAPVELTTPWHRNDDHFVAEISDFKGRPAITFVDGTVAPHVSQWKSHTEGGELTAWSTVHAGKRYVLFND